MGVCWTLNVHICSRGLNTVITFAGKRNNNLNREQAVELTLMCSQLLKYFVRQFSQISNFYLHHVFKTRDINVMKYVSGIVTYFIFDILSFKSFLVFQ